MLVAAITLPWILWAIVAVALLAREWVAAACARARVGRARRGGGAARAFAGGGGPLATGGQRLVVMSANLRFGEADAASVLALAREDDVDVLSLQALTPEAVRPLDAAGARELLPGPSLAPRRRAAGTGPMSRGPLRPLVEPTPEGRASDRSPYARCQSTGSRAAITARSSPSSPCRQAELQLRPGANVARAVSAAASVAPLTNAIPSTLRRLRDHRRSRRVAVLA